MAQMEAILRALHREMAHVLGDRLEQILLFGSQARGEARPDSDIDILVVVRGEYDYADLIHRTSPIIAALSLRYDVVISRAFVSRERYEREQSPFLLNVRREGVAI
jgi:uncharacterized protein